MSGKEDRDIIDRRLEETLDLFKPTAGDEASTSSEPAAAPKSRRWDVENPAFSFRILPEDNERIGEWASKMGWTRDEIARVLMGAALEALDAGLLELDIERETVPRETSIKTKTGQTTRRYYSTKSAVRWKWKAEDKPGGQTKSAAS